MLHPIRCLVALILLVSPALAGQQADYTLAFEPGGKRWTVEARFDGRGEEHLDFHFALWTPGAYHTADYGRFVKEFTASDSHGAELAVERLANGHFAVRGTAAAEEVVIRYQADSSSSSIFSNQLIDVESNRIARDYAYVNPVSLFGFLPARAAEPLRLTVRLPKGWKAATALESDDAGRFLAPSYLRFEDSPFLFSPKLEAADFTVAGKAHRVSVHGRKAADVRAIAAGCERIVTAGAKLMKGLPYESYHFLFGFADEAGGSGLEHSFSTLILMNSGTRITAGEHSFWGIVAHEYFHLWCAERIHVETIRKPDLLAPLRTGTIWVNEGITEYFCRHILLHAGFTEPEELLASYLAPDVFPPGVLGAGSWTDVSRAAADWNGMSDVMAFAARMYAVGPRTIFALDMSMRRATGGARGVLDLLHHLDADYAQKDRGFGEDELDDILVAVAGPTAREFFERYIDGEEIPEPAQFLDVIGYRAEGSDVAELEPASEEQLRARRDYFSITGTP